MGCWRAGVMVTMGPTETVADAVWLALSVTVTMSVTPSKPLFGPAV